MKKSNKTTGNTQDGKGFLALAGEAFSVLGEEIVEGKDKLMDAASEKLTAVKKSIKKITRKKAPVKRKVAPKKAVKRPSAKTVKKVARLKPKKVTKKTIVKKKK